MFIDMRDVVGIQCHIFIVCGQVFDVESELGLHMKTHSFLCDICGKVLLTIDWLECNKQEHEEGHPHACDICNKTFKYGFQLRVHQKEVNSGIKSYICNICTSVAMFKSSLKTHLKRHDHDFRFHCDICGKGCYAKCQLQLHKNLHTGKQSFGCSVCGNAFSFSRIT